MTTPFAFFVLMMGCIFVGFLYWFKFRMLKRRLDLSIFGFIISAFPTLAFFSYLHFLIQHYFHCEGRVVWVVSPSENLVGWFNIAPPIGFMYVPLSALVISAIFTPIFLTCLALLFKECKSRRHGQRKPENRQKKT